MEFPAKNPSMDALESSAAKGTQSKRTSWSARKKWLSAVITSAGIFVLGTLVRYAINPWEWYRQLRTEGGLIGVGAAGGNRIQCLYYVEANAGTDRQHILQAKDRFILSLIEVELLNSGNKPAEHAYVNVELGNEATEVRIQGLPDAEYLDNDGSYLKMGSEWRKVGKLVRVRYEKLQPGLPTRLWIGIARVKEKRFTPPQVIGGDDAVSVKGEQKTDKMVFYSH